MILNRRDLRPGHLGNLSKCPSESVNEDNRGPLPMRQGPQYGNQPRLDLRLVLVIGPERERKPTMACATLANSEEIPGCVLHPGDPAPVLPRVGECLGGGLASTLAAVGSDQRPPEARLILQDESAELCYRIMVGMIIGDGFSPPKRSRRWQQSSHYK